MSKNNLIVEIIADRDAQLEVTNIHDGAFAPLQGFMTRADYQSVIEDMHLKNGEPWTIPVTLDVPEEKVREAQKCDVIQILNDKRELLAELQVEDVFEVDFENDVKKIFGTTDTAHPGVKKEMARSRFRVGGRIKLYQREEDLFPEFAFTPKQTREIFAQKGWKTVTGFQTRNPIHRAHEYLQRVALELTDGLFIQPLIGWKKKGDVTPEAVLGAYSCMVENFYSSSHVLLGCLRTPMRYAGPREAVFHAIIRRNYGCTHFIVGRDHAGVGNFYNKYEAQKLCREFNNLGIEILTLKGPYYCQKCSMVVTEKTCPHGEVYALSVSGTELRALIREGKRPPQEFMREEISEVLMSFDQRKSLFVEE